VTSGLLQGVILASLATLGANGVVRAEFEAHVQPATVTAGMTDRYAMEFWARLRSDAAESMFKPI